MPQDPSPKLPIALGILILTVGCGIEPDTLEAFTEVVNRGADSGFAQEMGNLSDRHSSAAGLASSDHLPENEGEAFTGSHSFEPLYPDRANPFVYPAETPSNSAAPTSTSVAEIQVMGFANVKSNLNSDSPTVESKVLLKTNAGIKSLAVGDQVGQITVLRIDSPTVELKMGSLIWTATMFDR